MKLTVITISLLTIFSIVSCKERTINEDYSGFKDYEFDIAAIKDTSKPIEKLAHIKIKIPAKLDSFYQWHRLSDCASCGKMEYRFANTQYFQFAESGFSWNTVPDSVFQLTFMHDPIVEERANPLKPLNKEDTVYLANYIANQSTSCDLFQFLYRKFVIVNGRPFILAAFTTNCSIITNNKPTLMLGAITSLKNTSLLVLAETNAQDTTGFESMIRKSLSTIKINE